MKTLISASILTSDFANLGLEVTKFSEADVDMIHIDVMDGNFVPNLTIGPQVVKSIRSYTKLPFDVHLMVKNPENYIEYFVDAGANFITIHYEAVPDYDVLLYQIKKIQELGVKAGISLMPSTSAEILDNLIDKVDLILIMAVNPGFGGQKFLSNQLEKIKSVSLKISKIIKCIKRPILSVDGGINFDTALAAVKSGANMLVIGSFISTDNLTNLKVKIRQLKNI